MIAWLKIKTLMRLKYLWHLLLFKIYKFDSWHISSIESRGYCIDVVNYINSKVNAQDCVIEIGCGLGETINKIQSNNAIGYDHSKEVISAAQIYHFLSKKKFQIGSFDDLKNKNIRYLIALNFLHDFDENIVSSWLKKIIDSNSINFLVVDEIADPAYQNNHHFKNILPKEFVLEDLIGKEYRYNRSVKVFKNLKA